MRQYLNMLQYILDHGTHHQDRTGVTTTSVFGYQERYRLQEGFPILTTKKLAFRWIAEELFWFLSGDTNANTLRQKGIDIWKEWATKEECARFGREEGDLGPVYGYLWRSFGGNYPKRDGVDQIRRLVHAMTHNANSRRLIVSGWDPRTCEHVSLPPCHTLFHFKVVERPHQKSLLHCQLYQRSADAFLGVPYNIASYALLTHMIAHVMDWDAGDFVHSFGDLHLYNNHIKQARLQISRAPRTLPTLVLNEDLRGGGLDALLSFSYKDLTLQHYHPHPKIEAPVAI